MSLPVQDITSFIAFPKQFLCPSCIITYTLCHDCIPFFGSKPSKDFQRSWVPGVLFL
jgi:hypothetical protein